MAVTDIKPTQLDSPKDVDKLERDPRAAEHRLWMHELKTAEAVFKPWHERADKIVARYRDERDSASTMSPTPLAPSSNARRYNALWSVTETEKPLLYNESPVPYVARKADVADPIARDASLILQKCLENDCDTEQLDDAISEAVEDYRLAGRGITWLRYGADFALRESADKTYVDEGAEIPEDPETGELYKLQSDDDGRQYYRAKYEARVNDYTTIEHVSYRDFLHGPAKKWSLVPWIARRVPMLETEIEERFGKEWARKLPKVLKSADGALGEANTDDFQGAFSRAEIWEIWDRSKRRVLWLCPQYKESIIEARTDILGLEGFFPCPKPMFATMTNNTLVPVPDFVQWQDVADELDEVTFRISLLLDALRVVGVYGREYGDTITKLTTDTRKNALIAVDNWSMFAERGGLRGAVDFFPIEQIITVLDKLYAARRALVQELYETTGISDIVRGSSDVRDTATAQKLKGQFASNRLSKKQRVVARHAKELLRMRAHVICKFYSLEKVKELSGAEQLITDAMGMFDIARFTLAFELLRRESVAPFRIKIDTETLAGDRLNSAVEEATQFITGTVQLLQSAAPLVGQAPNLIPVIGHLLMFGVRKFKVGRTAEAAIEETVRKFMAEGSGAPPPDSAGPPPSMSPDEVALENRKLDLEAQRLGIERQKLILQERAMGLKAQGDASKLAQKDSVARTEQAIRVNKQQMDARDKQEDRALAAEEIVNERMRHHHDAALDTVDFLHRQKMDYGEAARDEVRAAHDMMQSGAAEGT